MKKTTTRVVYATTLLAATLAISQLPIMKNQGTHIDEPPNAPNPVENIATRSHSTIRTKNDTEVIGIGENITNLPIGNNDVALISEDLILENMTAPGGDYDYIAYNPGYREGSTGNYGLANGNSAHTSSGTGAGATGHSPRKTGQSSYANPVGGGNGGGGYSNPGTRKDEKNAERKDAASSTPGKDTNPNEGKDKNNPNNNNPSNKSTDPITPPNKEKPTNKDLGEGNITTPKDKGNPGQSNDASGKDGHSNEPTGTNNPSTSEPGSGVEPSSPYFDSPPGNGSNTPPLPASIKEREISGNPGEATIPEPVSTSLIGLGGIMLLWSRRRISRN